MRSPANLRKLIAFAALVAVVCLAAASLRAAGSRVAAEESNRAGIVVSLGDGRTLTGCVEFSEAEISGAELLRRSELPVVAMSGGAGAAICKIDNVGCDNPNDCFCQCYGSDCRYWAYYTLVDGGWQYAAQGASLRKVHSGDVDGWAWGSGSIGAGAKPDVLIFDQVCQPPATPTDALLLAPTLVPSAGTQPLATAVADNSVTPSPEPPRATPTPINPAAVTIQPSLGLATLPTAMAALEEPQADGSSDSFPWQIPVFAVVAVALLGSAVVLARRRAHG